MQTCEVLGSTAEFRIVTENTARVEDTFSSLWTIVYDFEQRFSRFIKDSELSTFNVRAGEIVPVSSQFRDILRTVQYFGELSQGSFNPFILPSLERAGYTTSMTASGASSYGFASRTTAPINALEVGDTWGRIPTDTALDLGGIGKGYLADLLAQSLTPFTESFCLSLGGDMRVSGREPHGPWTIDVESATEREVSVGTYTHQSASTYGIATSGTQRIKRGVSQAHLIDPRTNAPTQTQYRSCTVVAQNAVSADVLASCVLIDGAQLADRLFREHHVEAILLQGEKHTEQLVWGTGFELSASLPTPQGIHYPTHA